MTYYVCYIGSGNGITLHRSFDNLEDAQEYILNGEHNFYPSQLFLLQGPTP